MKLTHICASVLTLMTMSTTVFAADAAPQYKAWKAVSLPNFDALREACKSDGKSVGAQRAPKVFNFTCHEVDHQWALNACHFDLPTRVDIEGTASSDKALMERNADILRGSEHALGTTATYQVAEAEETATLTCPELLSLPLTATGRPQSATDYCLGVIQGLRHTVPAKWVNAVNDKGNPIVRSNCVDQKQLD